MTVKATSKRNRLLTSPESASEKLRNLSPQESFLFFTDVDQYTGQFASSLVDFHEKLNTLSTDSLKFHFRRGDFRRWIRGTLRDKVLANRISKLNSSLQEENLRKSIQKIVKRRLDELRIATARKN